MYLASMRFPKKVAAAIGEATTGTQQ